MFHHAEVSQSISLEALPLLSAVVRQGAHLVRLWENPALGQRLVEEFEMPPMLIHALKSWGGTQDVVTSLAGGEVSFQPRVAMRVGPLSCPLYLTLI